MRVLILGAGGMLGQALHAHFSTDHDVTALNRSDLDVTVEASVRKAIRDLQPQWVLHAAAFTRVDDAESLRQEALRVNAYGARNAALAAAESGASLLYYSTDYVFSGNRTIPYTESDLPNPVNHYGATKLLGEHFVRSLCPSHLILRTSWLFGEGGGNFVSSIIAVARSKERLEVVADQEGKPTWTGDLARMSATLTQTGASGLFHVTNSGHTSWYDFAKAIVEEMQIPCRIDPVTTDRYPRAARRPRFSVLENAELRRQGYPEMPHWRTALTNFLKSIHVATANH